MGGLEICPQCGYGSPSATRKKEEQQAAQLTRYFDRWKLLISAPEGSTLTVDNRVFVLGLDKLYRDAMKGFEEKELLACAEKVAATLSVEPASVPIEGYYTESPALTRYFRLMRALQEEGEAKENVVRHLSEFQLLWGVTTSPLYGRSHRNNKLLPVGSDPLSQALKDTIPNWSVERLIKAAYSVALQYEDFSLVGLAARARDAVVLTATRESVVLYAKVVTKGVPEEPEFRYEWRVDESLAEAANRFIEIFNRFVPGGLPKAEAINAEKYYKAYADNEIIGRCVRVGQTEDGSQHYHWAIAIKHLSQDKFELGVDEFWSEHIWTTREYREAQGSPAGMRVFQVNGVP
jgi:hypothetical protein